MRRNLLRSLLAFALIAVLSPAWAAATTGGKFRARDSHGRPLAHISAYSPNDDGNGKGWAKVQWNFTGPFGVGAYGAWNNLISAGHPGGSGTTVAVLDTGVAYQTIGRYKRSPDLLPNQFVRGYDFVDQDSQPLDEHGHGTHVASTIAERTNNRIGLTGLAYGAKIMSVRVLDSIGEGDAVTIARGVRYATDRGVDVINLSLEFDSSVRARELRPLLSAIAYANRKGIVVVGASGNEGDDLVSYPARDPTVIAVGATTEHGCLSAFSNQGPNLDLVAPGGGPDADLAEPNCRPDGRKGRNISQVTFKGSKLRGFGIPRDYAGTSMAVPHVSATAAMVIASGVIGPHPTPQAVEARLTRTARDLGPPGPDVLYGAGLLDAAAATSRFIP
ncbi:MAG TPA: S8 family serine peptidase [Baekduia sp.]|nr:S8 family serine peptidase [Baekduia sp.]